MRLLRWNLESDSVEGGQWLKGRIYERRCDLSPDGSLLVYFAAKFRGPVYSWTAVSRPPWLTALSFFPKGDCWGGGGLFDGNRVLRLNHPAAAPPESEAISAAKKGKKLKRVARYMQQSSARPWEVPITEDGMPVLKRPEGPRNSLKLKIAELGEHPGSGEDNPILSMRLERDGWTFVTVDSNVARQGTKSADRFWLTFDPPMRRRKPILGSGLKLQVSWHGLRERNNRWYVETMEVLAPDDREYPFGRVDWADIDHNGEVLYAADGKLMRLEVQEDEGLILSNVRVVADLNDMTFEEIATSDAVGVLPL